MNKKALEAKAKILAVDAIAEFRWKEGWLDEKHAADVIADHIVASYEIGHEHGRQETERK